MKADVFILTRKAVFGGFTAVWQCEEQQLPIEAYMAVGKGDNREEAMRDLILQIPNDVLNRSLRPFQVQHSNKYHPV